MQFLSELLQSIYLCDVTLDDKFILRELKLGWDRAKCKKASEFYRCQMSF